MENIETVLHELISFTNPIKIMTVFNLGLISIFAVILSLLILIFLIIIIVIFFLNNKKSKNNVKKLLNENEDSKISPSLFNLRSNLETIKNRISETRTDLENFKLDLEDYGVDSLRKEENLNEKYHRILGNLFLLIDHFEIYRKHRKKSDKINWFYEKARWILEQEGIEEIPATRGEFFNDLYHQQVQSHPHKLPDGIILEVISKGYYKKSENSENDIIFRPAKVVVSSGPAKKNHGSNINNEVKDE